MDESSSTNSYWYQPILEAFGQQSSSTEDMIPLLHTRCLEDDGEEYIDLADTDLLSSCSITKYGPAREYRPPAMGSLHQFRLLFWKNWLLQRRSPLLTLFELGLPIFFALILVLIRQRVEVTEYREPRTWPAFGVDKWPLPNGYQGNTGSFYPPRQIAFTPDLNITRRVVATMRHRLGMDPADMPFPDEDSMVRYLTADNTSLSVWGGITFTCDFPDENTLPERISYKIRPPSSENRNPKKWYSNRYFAEYLLPGPRQKMAEKGGIPHYYNMSFLTIQRQLDMSILHVLGGSAVAEAERIDVTLQRFPYPPYQDDAFVFILQVQFPFILMLSFIVMAPSITKDVVLEKERKLKEFMKMMGLKGWLHWAAWFLKYTLFMLLSVLFMTALFCIPMGPAAIIHNIDPSLMFVFLLLYAMATVMFCFAVSVFFKKANSGAAAGGILFFLTYVPSFFIQMSYDKVSAPTKWTLSLLHNVALTLGCTQIGAYEGTGAGLQWYNFYKSVSPDENFTMLDIFIMLIVDIFLYGGLVWYFSNVMPGDFGVPSPWYFPFTKSYWCGSSMTVSDDHESSLDGILDPEFFENEPYSSPHSGIKIRNLRKTFNRGKTVAVKGTYLNINEGQITALLGHNGAGKTTTMSMLTGFLPPTSGTAYINGLDIRTDIDGIRRTIGLCPQHNILYDQLTVKEHLTFYAQLKRGGQSVEKEVDEMINLLRLEDKTHAKSHSLSGGMKRKLHCGIALVGGSKIVMLDEPTSGMDPEARRQLWEVLQSQRQGRTMVLSTHFMDEADLLGDRIAIMAEGAVKCAGSSLFLKNKYGVGYHMVMVKEPGCDVTKITDTIESYVPDAKLESNISAELSFILPTESKAHFEELFTFLEVNKSTLGVSSFGASVTTMEEVFMKVGEEVENTDMGEQVITLPAITKPDGAENQAFASDNGHVSYETTGTPSPSAPPIDCIGKQEFNEIDAVPVSEYQQEASYNDAMNANIVNDQRPAVRRQSSLIGHARQERAFSIEDRWHLTPVMGEDLRSNVGLTLYWQQFRALFVKRALHSWRNRLVTLTQLIVPLFFTILTCIVIKTLPVEGDPPSLVLSLGAFKEQHVAYVTHGDSTHHEDTVELLSQNMTSTLQDVVETFEYVNTIPEYRDDPDITQFIGNITSMDDYTRKYIFAADIRGLGSEANHTAVFNGIFNNQGYHAIAIALNAMGNTLLRAYGNSTHSIGASNHPLPLSDSLRVDDDMMKSMFIGFTISSNVLFGLSFLIATFVLFLIKERSLKAKHVQFVSGVRAETYWISTFCWDFINFFLATVLLIPVFAAFNIEPYITGSNAGYLVVLLLLFGWAVLPFTYIFSHMFQVPSSGYVWSVVFNMVSGIAAVLAVYILRVPQLDTLDIAKGLEWAFYVLLPNFSLGKSLQDLYTNYENEKICSEFAEWLWLICLVPNTTNPCCPETCAKDGGYCATYQKNYLSWEYPGIGRALVFLAIQGFVCFVIILVSESGTVQSLLQMAVESTSYTPTDDSDGNIQVSEDEDVTRERLRILGTSVTPMAVEDSLILCDLRKWYGNFLAVDRLTVGIPQGECFGLLGVNGAGKTSTFQMLTGDSTISSGDAFLYGYSVKNSITKVQSHLGYCPQFDALIDQMTVRETLTMFGHLRGVHEDQLPSVVNRLVQSLLLSDHVDKQAGDLSGGNKRKLSAGIALIGDPPVIFLDEPTTGMDPVARRRLWDSLSRVRASGRTLVLTSHSMEECEALCTRLAIMVNGQFKCLGSTQHLKTKFGEGYTLLAKIALSDPPQMEAHTTAAMAFIEQQFPGSLLKDRHHGYLHYHVPARGVTWAQLFGTMERSRDQYGIEDYSVSQTTLEQVFINFARAQRPPLEDALSCTTQCGNCCSFFCCCACRALGDKTQEGTHL